MNEADKKAIAKYIGMKNNALGHEFESLIEAAAAYYLNAGAAAVSKTPEPFRVKRKNRDGTATVYFVAHAEPDFKGVLAGGRCIAFESKHTTTGRLKQEAVTPTQAAMLTDYMKMGAVAAVCACIDNKTFMIPWGYWLQMKEQVGHKYITAIDAEPFRVKFNGIIKFLDLANFTASGLTMIEACDLYNPYKNK